MIQAFRFFDPGPVTFRTTLSIGFAAERDEDHSKTYSLFRPPHSFDGRLGAG
jgi:hypothetical protein